MIKIDPAEKKFERVNNDKLNFYQVEARKIREKAASEKDDEKELISIIAIGIIEIAKRHKGGAL